MVTLVYFIYQFIPKQKLVELDIDKLRNLSNRFKPQTEESDKISIDKIGEVIDNIDYEHLINESNHWKKRIKKLKRIGGRTVTVVGSIGSFFFKRKNDSDKLLKDPSITLRSLKQQQQDDDFEIDDSLLDEFK